MWLFAPLSKSFSFLCTQSLVLASARRAWRAWTFLIGGGCDSSKDRHGSGPFKNKSCWSSHDFASSLIWAQFSILINNLVPRCEDCGPERLETGFSSRLFQGEEQTTRKKRWTRRSEFWKSLGNKDPEVLIDHQLTVSRLAPVLNTYLPGEYGSGIVKVSTTKRRPISSVEWAENTLHSLFFWCHNHCLWTYTHLWPSTRN